MSNKEVEFEYCGSVYTVQHMKDVPSHQPDETDTSKMSWCDNCWICCDSYCATIEVLVKHQELLHFQNPKKRLIVPSLVVSRICSWARLQGIKV